MHERIICIPIVMAIIITKLIMQIIATTIFQPTEIQIGLFIFGCYELGKIDFTGFIQFAHERICIRFYDTMHGVVVVFRNNIQFLVRLVIIDAFSIEYDIGVVTLVAQ